MSHTTFWVRGAQLKLRFSSDIHNCKVARKHTIKWEFCFIGYDKIAHPALPNTLHVDRPQVTT